MYFEEDDDGFIKPENVFWIVRNYQKINLREIVTDTYTVFVTDTSNEFDLQLQAYDRINNYYVGEVQNFKIKKEFINDIENEFPLIYGTQSSSSNNKKNKITNI